MPLLEYLPVKNHQASKQRRINSNEDGRSIREQAKFFQCDFGGVDHCDPPDKSESIIKIFLEPKTLFVSRHLSSAFMAIEMLIIFREVNSMMCPACESVNEMAYSVLSN